MQRYFIKNKQINNNIITINDSDVHHIKDVMRMQIGDEVICCDELENVYLAKIIDISSIVTLNIIKKMDTKSELKVEVTIAQGLIRREKTEEVIRRLTELGCYTYIPVEMTRSIVKAKSDRSERWNKIVKEASEQSQRNRLMQVQDAITFQQLLTLKNNYDLCLVAHVTENTADFHNIIHQFKGKKILIVVGPEGGFDNKEVTQLLSAGFIFISLGSRILRTETAPLYIMSILGYEFE